MFCPSVDAAAIASRPMLYGLGKLAESAEAQLSMYFLDLMFSTISYLCFYLCVILFILHSALYRSTYS